MYINVHEGEKVRLGGTAVCTDERPSAVREGRERRATMSTDCTAGFQRFLTVWRLVDTNHAYNGVRLSSV